MSEHTGSTDQTHRVQLTSTIEQVMWTRTMAAPEGLVGLEIFTHYVGDNAEMVITLSDEAGASFGAFADKLFGNYFKTEVRVPAAARQGLFANVELRQHGLSKKSTRLGLLPRITVTHARWDRETVLQGDILALAADVTGAPDGTEAVLTIFEHDEDGAHERITKFVTVIVQNKVEALWEFFFPGPIVVPSTEAIEAGLAEDGIRAAYFFDVDVAGIKAESGVLSFEEAFPTVTVKWSKGEVAPDHGEVTEAASEGTTSQSVSIVQLKPVVPEEAKVALLVETTGVPDGTGATITIHHCHTGALIPGGTLAGLIVQGGKVVDNATGEAPVWTFEATHLPWDPWDKPFFYFKVAVAHLGLQAETPKDYVNREAETLRVIYWHACVSAVDPQNAFTQEMDTVAALLEGRPHHRAYKRSVEDAFVENRRWGLVVRNTCVYHHASHGFVYDHAQQQQLDVPGMAPPESYPVPGGTWRSVVAWRKDVIVGPQQVRSFFGEDEVKQVDAVPSVPRYLVYMNTCLSAWEPSLGQAFRSRGTRYFIGFRTAIDDNLAFLMAGAFYTLWRDWYQCSPDKIPLVFFTIAPVYWMLWPMIMGDIGADAATSSSAAQAQSAIGTAVGGFPGIGSLLQ